MTRTTKPSKLESIAARMREYITITGALYAHQRLDRGLELVLQRHLESNGKVRWRLALGRPDVAPSEDEVAICRAAFDVPVGTEHQAVQSKSRVNPKTNRTTIWYVAEMYWYES